MLPIYFILTFINLFINKAIADQYQCAFKPVSKDEMLSRWNSQIKQMFSNEVTKLEAHLEARLEAKLQKKFKEIELKQRTSKLPCKMVSLSNINADSPPFSMENDALNHVTVKRDAAGHLTYFEMHIAVQADAFVRIRFSDKENFKGANIQHNIDVGLDSNQYTQIDVRFDNKWTNAVQRARTPDVLSSNQFSTFYIKIEDGYLKFGKEGVSIPLISNYDIRIGAVNYFQLYYGGNNNAKIGYNCPARVEELSCKEISLSTNADSPPFSMENDALNHVTVKRDAAGHLTYFEMHIAVQADAYVRIRFSDKENFKSSNIQHNIDVGLDSNQYTQIDVRSDNKWTNAVQRARTPDVLSSNQFSTFYIKIEDGYLKFGKEGGSSPLISNYDIRIGSLNYFQLYYGGSNKAMIRYDCPAHVEGSS